MFDYDRKIHSKHIQKRWYVIRFVYRPKTTNMRLWHIPHACFTCYWHTWRWRLDMLNLRLIAVFRANCGNESDDAVVEGGVCMTSIASRCKRSVQCRVSAWKEDVVALMPSPIIEVLFSFSIASYRKQRLHHLLKLSQLNDRNVCRTCRWWPQ